MFKHCPHCGKRIKKFSARLISCPSCGFNFYLAPAVTNALIIENNNREILLVKRKNPPKKNYWDLPGGFIEFAESGETSVRREIKEELGINLKNFTYFKSYPDRYWFKGINYHTLNLVYLAQIENKKLEANDDIVAYKFFPKNKIPYQRLAFFYMKKALADYLSSPH